ncbi:MAG: serine hydrolase [Candidatus Aminicenantes bacterium]|nr:serine hydrolase [Candidatus Aminicenantes bacterium]
MTSEPGTQFLYNSGTTNVLGEVIRKTTGLRADDFADLYLFTPLGITDCLWAILSNNVCYTSGDLKLRPRDMAKLGALYLHDGIRNERQIISKEWIEESTKSFISTDPYRMNWEYGYQWWLNTYKVQSRQIPFFSALGWGGQGIIVFPDLDMVVVTTAGYYDEPDLEFHIDVLLMQKIFESVL